MRIPIGDRVLDCTNHTAIMGIVREDQSRFSDDTRATFLKQLGVTERQWYGK